MILVIHREFILQFLKIAGEMVRQLTDPLSEKRPSVQGIMFQTGKLRTNLSGSSFGFRNRRQDCS
ncbi:MAG: hypothetical protein K1X85_13295 [Ignavibacteria bacterium]|nr:hypothetical protein [Ignavibacteria bacterium]